MRNTAFKLVTLIIVSIFTNHAQAQFTELNAKYLQVLRLKAASGKISIQSTKSGKASVNVTKVNFSDEKCKLVIETEKDTFSVIAERKSLFSVNECEVNLDIKIPKNMNLYLTVGAGSVTVTDIAGILDFKLGAGDLKADGTFSHLEGISGAGSIVIKGLTGGGNVMAGSGSISLSFAKTSLSGEIDLKSGSGDANLEFPKGAKIRTSFVAGAGEMINEIGDTADAPFMVKMKSGAGDLRIKSY